MLSEAGFDDESRIIIAQDVSSNSEIMRASKLGDLKNFKTQSSKYFSIMVAKKNDKS
jgi:hypothetical protein